MPDETLDCMCVFLSEDEEGVMVGQSQAVSTEALMNVFHPHDAENLDPKMVQITLLQYWCNVCLVKMINVIKTCAIHYQRLVVNNIFIQQGQIKLRVAVRVYAFMILHKIAISNKFCFFSIHR